MTGRDSMATKHEIQQQAKNIVKEAREHWGQRGWALLSPDQRWGAICVRLVALSTCQSDEGRIPIAYLNEIVRAARGIAFPDD